MNSDPNSVGVAPMDVAQRLQALEDIESIRKLKAAYCAACDDDHNGDRVAALFVEDGTWQRSDQSPCRGHDEIAGYMYAIRRARIMNRSAHMVTNPVIHVDGDTATGTWRFVMMYTGADDASFVRIIGHYEDRYVRRDGRWLFQSLVSHVEESGRYEAAPSKLDRPASGDPQQ